MTSIFIPDSIVIDVGDISGFWPSESVSMELYIHLGLVQEGVRSLAVQSAVIEQILGAEVNLPTDSPVRALGFSMGKSFVFTAHEVRASLCGMSRHVSDGTKPALNKIVQTLDDEFPGVKPFRNSIAHVDERVEGSKDGNRGLIWISNWVNDASSYSESGTQYSLSTGHSTVDRFAEFARDAVALAWTERG